MTLRHLIEDVNELRRQKEIDLDSDIYIYFNDKCCIAKSIRIDTGRNLEITDEDGPRIFRESKG